MRQHSTIKVSIELPVTTRYHRDMTEKIVESNVKLKQTTTATFILEDLDDLLFKLDYSEGEVKSQPHSLIHLDV